ncbi:MAG: GNAT family N-acetyltransferase [Rhodospirillales bacterium]|nr:GNAT family N-acetyltransferase [Rhodospirillales bacterium]
MTTLDVKVAMADEKAAVFAILTLAFSTDPATRWTWPDPKAYLEAFPHFASAFGGAAFEKGSALRVGSAGAALWLPPGTGPDETALNDLMMRTADAATAIDGPQLMQQMAGHHPKEPHWYLPLLGVDPAHQNSGVGSALLRYVTDRCDREGVLAYLESSNPRNIPLYERHGFEIVGRAQSGSSPVITPMLRRPQRRR